MKRFNIKYQILAITMVPVVLIDVFLTSVHIKSSITQAEQLLQSKGEIIAKQIASASEFYLFSGNYDQIQHLLNQSINQNEIIFSSVYDQRGELVAEARGEGYLPGNSPQYLYYRQPIQTQDIDSTDVFQTESTNNLGQLRTLGWIHLYISRQKLEQSQQDIYTEGMLFFLGMLVLAMTLSAIISHRITRPVFELLNYLKKIEQGELGEVIKDVKNNEIGAVQKGFNSMSLSLLANRQELNQKINIATQELRHAVQDLENKNRELGVARDAAQEANRVKSQFLANISHEIRTPINGIKGFVNLLSQSGLNLGQKRYTDIIKNSIVDLNAIINEVLDFSKIESGKIQIEATDFKLFDLVESTRDSLFTISMEKGIDLHLVIFSDTPNHLVGDPFRLKQILINLVNNAIKFTDRGYVRITVFEEDEISSGTRICFRIEDSGIGISEENQKLLFHAFSQIDSSSNRKYAGTGLGLVISRNLAQLMGGDIMLQSKIGEGTTFTLRLPFRLADIPPVDNPLADKTALVLAFNQRCLQESQALIDRVGLQTETQLIDPSGQVSELQEQLLQNLTFADFLIVDLRHAGHQPPALAKSALTQNKRVVVMHYDVSLIDSMDFQDCQFISVINTTSNIRHLLTQNDALENTSPNENFKSMKPRRILIVDDNPINLKLATELTQLWGHQPFEAAHATQAMTLFDQHVFDLILLDIQMPEIDGIELMKMMREKQPDLPTPVVAVTANALPAERDRLLRLGFDDYLAKPLDENKLRTLLEDNPGANRPPEETAIPEPEATSELSIDYAQSLSLSGNNRELADEMLKMLHKGIPTYRVELSEACAKRSLGKLAFIIHNLQGVTCYTGLPRLKALLSAYDRYKHVDREKTIQSCVQMVDELQAIENELENHLQSA